MAALAVFAKPTSPSPSAAQARLVLSEKRISRVTFRLSDTLKSRMEHRAAESGMTLSDYIVHLAALESERQAAMGQTRADIAAARRALDLLDAEEGGELTAGQRLWALRRLHNVAAMVLAGKRVK